MRQTARQIADNASFQAFMNSYLKEVDSGVWHEAPHWQQQTGQALATNSRWVLEIKLPKQNLTLAVAALYRSQVGRHTLTEVHQKSLHQFDWQPMDFFATILLLIKEIYSSAPDHQNSTEHKTGQQRSQELELMARLIESQQVMTRYLEQRIDDPALESNRFIESEQSILFGHWLHPTPKSRQGIHEWQHQEYTPELKGQFQLHYFSVDRHLIQQGSILSQSAETILEKLLSDAPQRRRPDIPKSKLLIPTHPLQAQWLLHQEDIQQRISHGEIEDIGPLGAYFTPTSSVRTLYCDSLDFMIKLSIPVKVTNSLRINMHHELEAGMAVANLFKKTGFSQQYPKFQTVDDPAYMTLCAAPSLDTSPDKPAHTVQESHVQKSHTQESGFELIIRENPFSQRPANGEQRSVVSIAALTQDGIGEDKKSRLATLIHQLATQEQRPATEVAADWFHRYWQCAIEPAIRLYDQHGIALEAHQQNSLLDISQGYPSHYFYRDNQGFYLSNTHKNKLLTLEPHLINTDDLFYDDGMIINRFSYYLVVNQLFSVIARLGIDQLQSEHITLEQCVTLLSALQPELSDRGATLVNALLSQPALACKGNLLTRIHDVDELQADQELAVYTQIKNPFRSIALRLGILTNKEMMKSEPSQTDITTASSHHSAINDSETNPCDIKQSNHTSSDIHVSTAALDALISASEKASSIGAHCETTDAIVTREA